MKTKILALLITSILLSLPSFAYFNMSVPVKGDSIANDELQHSVVKKIYTNFAPKNPTCSNFSIDNTQIVHYPYDVKKKNGKYVKGYWTELWTLNTCGKLRQIPINFNINSKTTTFTIENYFLDK